MATSSDANGSGPTLSEEMETVLADESDAPDKSPGDWRRVRMDRWIPPVIVSVLVAGATVLAASQWLTPGTQPPDLQPVFGDLRAQEAAIAALQDRVAALEAAHATATAHETAASIAENSGPAVDVILAGKGRETVRMQPSAAPARPQLVMTETIVAMQSKIAALELQLKETEALARSLSRTQQGGAGVIAFARLRDEVRAARAYDDALQGLLAVMDGTGALSDAIQVLKDHASGGIVAEARLQERFVALVKDALTRPAGDTEGLADRAARSLSRVIVIRRVGDDVQGMDPDAIIARAESAMQKGDIAAAVEEIASLPPSIRAVYEDWLTDARAHVAVNDALADVYRVVLAEAATSQAPVQKAMP